MTDKPDAFTFTDEEKALTLGAFDIAARHLGAQLQQGGIDASVEAVDKLSKLNALAAKVRAAAITP